MPRASRNGQAQGQKTFQSPFLISKQRRRPYIQRRCLHNQRRCLCSQRR